MLNKLKHGLAKAYHANFAEINGKTAGISPPSTDDSLNFTQIMNKTKKRFYIFKFI